MYFVARDNAYVCTEHLLTPFCGSTQSFPQGEISDMHTWYSHVDCYIGVTPEPMLVLHKWGLCTSPHPPMLL
jgi:hypothetical protein